MLFSGNHQAEMSAEDKQTVVELYQRNPKLWADFRNIIDFMDQLQQDSWNYRRLLALLCNITLHARTSLDAKDRCERVRFAVAVGFVERSVELYMQIRTEMRLDYLIEIQIPSPSAEMACLVQLNGKLLNGSGCNEHFRIRLCRTGVLQTVLNDVKHMQHTSADALVSLN